MEKKIDNGRERDINLTDIRKPNKTDRDYIERMTHAPKPHTNVYVLHKYITDRLNLVQSSEIK